MTSLQAESCLLITWSPSQTCHAKPKLNCRLCWRYQLLSCWWDAYRKQLGLKDFLRKVRTLWHCSRLRSVALTLAIDRGDIRQAIDRCSNIWASLPGAGYVRSPSIRLTAWLQNCGSGEIREITMSRVTAIISALVICIIVCLSWLLIITVSNAITYKAQRDKNARELKLANAAITGHADASADVAALDAKYMKELADAKAENDSSAWWCCRWSSSVAHQSSLSVSAWSHHAASGVDNAASLDWQTPLNGIISPSERGWSLCKTTGRTQKYINEQCR